MYNISTIAYVVDLLRLEFYDLYAEFYCFTDTVTNVLTLMQSETYTHTVPHVHTYVHPPMHTQTYIFIIYLVLIYLVLINKRVDSHI